jgi:hypothetical protein
MSWTRKITLRLTTALMATATIAGLALPAALPASASSLPKTQTNGFGNWNSGWAVRPGGIVFGSYYYVQGLRYRYYTGNKAYAHGKLFVDNCVPNCAAAGYFANATVYTWDVFNHRGPGRHFGNLRLRWGRHLQHSRLMWINSRGQWWWRGA